MRKLLSLAAAAGLSATLLGGASALFSPDAKAAGLILHYTYYESSQHLQMVGGRTTNLCTFETTSWGQQTQYYILRKYPC